MYLPVHVWLTAFLITAAVEVPIATWLLRRLAPRDWRLPALVVFANLATHPAVWFIFPQLLFVSTPQFLVVSETWAVAVEAVFYFTALRGLTPSRAIATSVLANAASFAVGFALAELLPALFV